MFKVIDLFSGVGGMSLGASQAGFSVIGAVELDPIAITSHHFNFPNAIHINTDISKLQTQELREILKLKSGELSGIIGGPPCQGFSRIGKQNIEDPRNSLFSHFFRIVRELEPDFFVAENVPGILDPKFDLIRKNALKLVSQSYNILNPILISANEIGAPTTRKRAFFIGFHKKKDISLSPVNFINNEISPIYVKAALEGLPYQVESDENSWTKIFLSKDNSYSRKISRALNNNTVGNAYSVEKYLVYNEVSGMVGTVHQPSVISRFENVLPGEVDRISRAPRLNLNGFSPTLRAGTGKDNGSYQAVRPIHPVQPRVITPREAARLQGFPDWFQFHRTKWHSFRQIGNSVSPIVAEYVLRKIYEEISR